MQKTNKNPTIKYLNPGRSKLFRLLSILVIILGIFLRLAQYFSDRSLWFDEALISLNVVNRSFSGLLTSLDYNQIAPAGFLLIEKTLANLFGETDYVLRVFPLFCGISSLFFFYKLTKYYLTPGGVFIALTLFAVTEPLIFYSSEVKPYQCDVMATLLMLLIATIIDKTEKVNLLHIILYSFIGMFLSWISIALVFIFAGITAGLLFKNITEKNWEKTRAILFCSSFWAFGFFLIYKIHLSTLVLSKDKLLFYKDSVITFDIFKSYFKYLNLYSYGVPQILFFTGLVSMLIKRKEMFFIFIFTILFMIFVSYFNFYRLANRLMLFTIPITILFIAEGFLITSKKLSANFFLLMLPITCLLFWHPMSIAAHNLINPPTIHEIKPVLKYIKEHSKENDILYVYPNAQYAYKFYAKQFGFNNDFNPDKSIYSADPELNRWIERKGYLTIALGINDGDKFLDNLLRLKGHKRVWVLLSQVLKKEHEAYIVSHLNRAGGLQLLNFSRTGAKVYLYDLSLCK